MNIGLLKKIFMMGLIVCMTAAISGCGEQAAEKKEIKIATGDVSGTYYPIGGAIAEIINKNISTLNASAESSKGSIDNINKLKDNSADLAIIQNDIAYYAANGTEMFKDNKVNNLRALASLYPETCQFVTLAGSDITSIEDLRGKRVAVGAQGSGTEVNARQILDIYSLTYNDIDPQYLSFTEAEAALKDGKVDVAFITAGFPTKAIQTIAEKEKIRILPITADKYAILTTVYPYYTKTIIPSGTYKDIDEDVQTVSVMALLASSDKIDDNTGRDIVKAIFANTESIKSAHSAGSFISEGNAGKGMSIKMNAGAERYFKDSGKGFSQGN